jgi:hypothetical protein
MADLAQQFGADLSLSSSGDLAVASGAQLGQQRVLRRLLTNPGDYLWNPSYGAGLGQFVGQPAVATRIAAVVRTQIFREAAVARTPEPEIDVSVLPSGVVTVSVRYVDATNGTAQALSFSVGEV